MNFNPVEIIRKKRDGLALSPEEIGFFIQEVSRKRIPDYQVSAFLMATYFQGMNPRETSTLTRKMIESGERISFRDGRPKIDKHSTGGVGDKVSIALAPLVAALGVDVPMVSGRGLGHTGGTLDKLESIPGFRTDISTSDFVRNVETTGVAMMGQSEAFVPADKLLYALRDVTATVECIPLITASILSKKAAEGISGLVLDIKTGSGAFMKKQSDAERLAKSLVTAGKELGLRVRALITDMSQPLGRAVGHTLEILECIDVLSGAGPEDLRDLTVELAAHMLLLGGKSKSLAAARVVAHRALQNGAALQKFREMCLAQGARIDVTRHREALTVSPQTAIVSATKTGTVAKIDTRELGMALVDLGGGRKKTTDTVDTTVGYLLHAKIGTAVRKQDPLLTVHYNRKSIETGRMDLHQILKRIEGAYCINKLKTARPKLIKKVILV